MGPQLPSSLCSKAPLCVTESVIPCWQQGTQGWITRQTLTHKHFTSSISANPGGWGGCSDWAYHAFGKHSYTTKIRFAEKESNSVASVEECDEFHILQVNFHSSVSICKYSEWCDQYVPFCSTTTFLCEFNHIRKHFRFLTQIFDAFNVRKLPLLEVIGNILYFIGVFKRLAVGGNRLWKICLQLKFLDAEVLLKCLMLCHSFVK